MNSYLIMAGCLSVVVAVIHSALGEVLIFSKLRKGKIVPTLAPSPLQARNIRILWATWHVASFFGAGFAAVFFWLATQPIELDTVLQLALALPMAASSALVLWATKGRHPGWIGLGAVAVLVFLA